MLNSYVRGSPQQNRNLNDSRMTTNILPPQITSTPCSSPSKPRTGSPLVTPRRFLGPRRYALSSNGTLNPLKSIKDPPGPLLTSTSYNVNVSTYIDSKSPGYTGRLVQYNEESSRNQQHTHQEKYGSPGLFPIVHLFKKDIPVITPKPKQVTVRIGTPELKIQYSQEHNRLLLGGIVRTNSVIKENSQSSNEASTRSVLDALKEISRKRIHASEEYEIMDERNKKLRRDCINGDGDCSKRNREIDSPTSDASTSPVAKQATKKLCTIDAVLASKTSSMYANYDTGNKRKTIEDKKTNLSPLNKKKFNNAETQTITASTLKEDKKNSKISEGPVDHAETVQKYSENTEILKQTKSSPKQVLKIFDDKPLEIIRKNRLGALLSALTGHEIPPIPMEDRKKALDQDWPPQKVEKGLVSILSSPDKQPKMVEKHVTFNIPENSTESSNSLSFAGNGSFPNNSAETLQEKGTTESQDLIQGTKNLDNCSNNQTSSLSINEKSFSNNTAKDTATISSIGSFQLDSTKAASTVGSLVPAGGFKFDLSKPPAPAKDSIDKNSNPSSFQLNPAACTSSTTEPKMSFISNVAASTSITSPSLLPKFGISSELGNSSQSPLKMALDAKILTKGVSPSTKTNSLGLPAALPQNNTQSTSNSFVRSDLAFGNNDRSSKAAVSLTSNSAQSTISPKSNVNTTVSTSDVSWTAPFTSKTVPSNSSVHSLPALVSAPIANITTTKTNSPSTTSAFGVSMSIPTFINSSKNILPTTTISSLKDSIPIIVSSNAPNFATGVTRSGGFSFTGGNSLPAFGTKSTTSASGPTSAPTNTFGNSSNFGDLQANTSFGTTKTTASYGTLSSSKVSFGSTASTLPMFAINSTPSFVTSSTSNNSGTESKAFVFGSGNSQTFGHSSTSVATSTVLTLKNSQSGMTLGTNTSASSASNTQLGSSSLAFGANMFSSAGSNTFGPSKSVPSYGSTTTPTFGTTTTAVFGASSTPTFGTCTPAFGITNTPTFSSSNGPVFGSSIMPSFGTTTAPTFGTTTVPNFGTTIAPTFGATTAPTFGTTTTPAFGTTTAPTFGTATTPAFGNTTAPTFGTTTAPTFGTTNVPSFGVNNATTCVPSFNTTPAFGKTTNAPTFGTSNSVNFGASSMNSSTFASTPNFVTASNAKSLFGTPNTLPFEIAKTIAPGFVTSNTFGVPSTTSSAFGTNNSSFGAPSTSPVFGTTNTPSFGGSNKTPSFGTTTAPTFAAGGSFNAPPFGVTAPFGTTPTTSGNTFNSNNTTLPFGNSTGTNSFNTFGNTNPPFNPVTTSSSFGSNHTFGNSGASATFGNNMPNNTFGNTNTAGPFGTGANSSTFANNNAVGSNTFGSGFGTTTTKSEQFPSQTNNMFGNNSTFGSPQSNKTPNPGAPSGGVFTFGSPNTQSSLANGVFAFGAADPSKAFNFSTPGTSGNGSGPSASSFPTGSGFGQPSGSMPNMFNIGSGSTTTQNRSRATVRAKRRN